MSNRSSTHPALAALVNEAFMRGLELVRAYPAGCVDEPHRPRWDGQEPLAEQACCAGQGQGCQHQQVRAASPGGLHAVQKGLALAVLVGGLSSKLLSSDLGVRGAGVAAEQSPAHPEQSGSHQERDQGGSPLREEETSPQGYGGPPVVLEARHAWCGAPHWAARVRTGGPSSAQIHLGLLGCVLRTGAAQCACAIRSKLIIEAQSGALWATDSAALQVNLAPLTCCAQPDWLTSCLCRRSFSRSPCISNT